MFLIKSFEWLHQLHSHDEVRRVADCIVAFGILLREGERERTKSRWVCHGNLEEKILLFLSVEFILIYIRDLQYRSKIPTPTSNGGKAKAIPSCPWYVPDLTIIPGRMPPFHQKWGCDHV